MLRIVAKIKWKIKGPDKTFFVAAIMIKSYLVETKKEEEEVGLINLR